MDDLRVAAPTQAGNIRQGVPARFRQGAEQLGKGIFALSTHRIVDVIHVERGLRAVGRKRTAPYDRELRCGSADTLGDRNAGAQLRTAHDR